MSHVDDQLLREANSVIDYFFDAGMKLVLAKEMEIELYQLDFDLESFFYQLRQSLGNPYLYKLNMRSEEADEIRQRLFSEVHTINWHTIIIKITNILYELQGA